MDSSQSDSGLKITGGRSVSVEVPKQKMVAAEDDSGVADTIPRLDESGFKPRSTRPKRISDNSESFSTDAIPAQESDGLVKTNDSQQSGDGSQYDDSSAGKKPAKRQLQKEITPASPKKGRRRGKTEKANNTVKRPRQLKLNLEQSHNRIRQQMNSIQGYKTAKVKQLEKRKALEQIERSLKEANSRLEQEVQDLKRQILAHEATIQGYHDDALELLGKDKAEAMQDEQVTEALTWLFTETNEWARTWSIERWNDEAKARVRGILTSHEKDGGKAFATKWLVAAIDEAVKDKQTPPPMVFNALLNWFLCTETFGRPFAHLGRSNQDAANNGFEDCMNWIMEAAIEECTESSNKLRARICSLVDKPSVLDGSKAAKLSSRQKNMQRLRQNRCEKIVALCLSEFGVGLQEVSDEDGQKRHKEMLEIVEAALRLSARLTSENPEVKVYFLDDLGKTKFDLRHDRFRPHRILKLDDEEYDDEAQRAEAEALVGRPFDMVVEPCIVRRGDAKGEEYDKEQVLHRGVVWMVKGMAIPREELSKDETSFNDQYSMQTMSPAGPSRGDGNGSSAASGLHLGGGVQGEPYGSAPPSDRASSYNLRRAPKPPSKYGSEDEDKTAVGNKKLVSRNTSTSEIPGGQARCSHQKPDRPTITPRHRPQSTDLLNDGRESTSEAEDGSGDCQTALAESRTTTPNTDARKKLESCPKGHSGRSKKSLARRASRQQASDSDNHAELQVKEEIPDSSANARGAARICKEEAPLGPVPKPSLELSRKRKNSGSSTKERVREPENIENGPPSKKVKTDVATESSHNESTGSGEAYVSITQSAVGGYYEASSAPGRPIATQEQDATAKLAEERSIKGATVTDGSGISFEEDGFSIIEQQDAVQVFEEPEPATDWASKTRAERPDTTGRQDYEPSVPDCQPECTSEQGYEISYRERLGYPEQQPSSNELPSPNPQASARAVTVNADSPLD
ncbi:hypothetical protein CLCR_04545 [Cladophialophora carrionii]|uniref:Uncharacterized protein n=1 Tax=Cladophialophora carrionii TaxID=86049 RepID=A0A1C1CK01_9EURO|nr:hypothetical protein CLCR_04545 [Cladophialophora carrionii]